VGHGRRKKKGKGRTFQGPGTGNQGQNLSIGLRPKMSKRVNTREEDGRKRTLTITTKQPGKEVKRIYSGVIPLATQPYSLRKGYSTGCPVPQKRENQKGSTPAGFPTQTTSRRKTDPITKVKRKKPLKRDSGIRANTGKKGTSV